MLNCMEGVNIKERGRLRVKREEEEGERTYVIKAERGVEIPVAAMPSNFNKLPQA